MAVKFIVIGKTTEKWVEETIRDYSGRISRYTPFTMDEVLVKSSPADTVMQARREGEKLLSLIRKQDFLILLDEKGSEFTSEGFAAQLEKWQMHTSGNVVFAIGGAYGFSKEVYEKASFKMALSKMTFTHQMVRTIFLEQLYRAFTIIRNEKYHH